MAGKPWRRATPLEYSDSPLADRINDLQARLMGINQELGAVSMDLLIHYERPRQARKDAAPVDQTGTA